MSDSVANTKSDAPTTRKCLSTRKALRDSLKNALPAIEGYENTNSEDATIEDVEICFFAEGGYNHLWLVSFSSKATMHDGATSMYKTILREPNDDALLPWQIENEIAHLTFIARNHPSIPVPQVYAYDTGKTGNEPFIMMEYIDGQPLSSAWTTYTEDEKLAAAQQVAEMIVELSEITFNRIGGLTLTHEIGPTVEGMKLFKGRDKFHSPDYYDIGPYNSTHAYVLAYYDKEIQYYTHAPEGDIDESLFDVVPRDEFAKSLQATRDRLASSASTFLPEQPYVLVHNDINGRNIMMRDKKVAAILDWEFAGSYPLSEMLGTYISSFVLEPSPKTCFENERTFLLPRAVLQLSFLPRISNADSETYAGGRGVDLLEMVDEETEEENSVWSLRMLELVAEAARARGWDEEKVELLVGEGTSEELGLARMEMIPDILAQDGSDIGSGDDVEG